MIDSLRRSISIVVPVYNEIGNIDEFVRRVISILETSDLLEFEIIFSVDPSTDGTIERIIELSKLNTRIKMIVFSRRVGQPTATLAGLDYATGDAAIVMDVDLQDPPELIPEMVSKWREGFEVVYAQRRHRDGETWIKKFVARVGYNLIDRFGEVRIPRNTGDFRLLDRRVIRELQRFPEVHGFLRGLVALVGFRQTSVLFDRPSRYSGTGNYNRFIGSVRIGLNGLVAFSSSLLNFSTLIGFFAAITSFVVAIAYATMKVIGIEFPIGNPTIVVLILLLGGCQLVCLGILGQYVGRIYEEVKRRPKYIIDRTLGLDIHGQN